MKKKINSVSSDGTKDDSITNAELLPSASIAANPMLHAADEYFKDLPGYAENYSVSNYGRIFSKKNRSYLTPNQNKKNKVWSVKLSKDGKPKTFSCAKLVALTFIENPNPKVYINAIIKDGNPFNYCVSNIEWGTSFHSYKAKVERYPELPGKFKPKKYNAPTRKMSEEMIEKLLHFRSIGYSSRQLADIFPIGISQICNIIKQRSSR
jgi:hypothetical protein